MFRAAMLALLLIVQCFPLSARAEVPKSEQHLQVFEDVWRTIGERYYDANLRGINWKAQRAEFRQRAANAVDETELYRVLREMVGNLHDSHTRVFAPEEKSDWRSPRFVGVGVSIREIENELVITNVEKGSPAERANLKIGDVLTKIDDAPAKDFFTRKIIAQRGASTAAAGRLKAAAGVFDGAADSVVRVNFRDASGRERFAALRREWRTLTSSLRVKRTDDTLIIAFDAFTPEIVREFFYVLTTNLRGARGIVLDLRTNRGGSTEAMTDIASAFLPENADIGKFVDRAGKTAVESKARRWLLYAASAVRVRDLPVVVLTGTATASAAEIFTAALKSSNRAKSIGATTCGCVLAIRRQHNLPDGGVLEISELDFQMPDGARLEGIGVAPDTTLLPTLQDVRQKRDRALEQALKSLAG